MELAIPSPAAGLFSFEGRRYRLAWECPIPSADGLIAACVQAAGGELLLRVHRGGEQIVSVGLLLKQISAEICYAHT
jgi:hypothetical protein